MLRFASLFSGCGGFDLGFIARGFQNCGAFDCDPLAIENYQSNVKGKAFRTNLLEGVPEESSLFNIDALIAGPPCQGFSTAGKRLINDKRNQLLVLTGKIALRINPKVLIVENVAGALSGSHARYWRKLDQTMRLSGYRTHTIYCQAANLGMAQLRKRILFFAWRTHFDISFAFENLPPGKLRSVLTKVNQAQNHYPKRLRPLSRDWLIARRIKPGQKLSNVRKGNDSVPTWNIPEVFGPISKRERSVLELVRCLRRRERIRDFGDADPVSINRIESASKWDVHNLINSLIQKNYLKYIDKGIDIVGTFNGKYRRLQWDKQSYAVDTRFGSPRSFLHPAQSRGFTVREAARIQGFEDSYVFSGSEKSQYRLIGNAVPPPLGAAAAEITKRLLGRAE